MLMTLLLFLDFTLNSAICGVEAGKIGVVTFGYRLLFAFNIWMLLDFLREHPSRCSGCRLQDLLSIITNEQSSTKDLDQFRKNFPLV